MIALLLLVVLSTLAVCRLLPTGRKKAKQDNWRISESTLLILAVIGGSTGAYLVICQNEH